jgi:hypothetical protein
MIPRPLHRSMILPLTIVVVSACGAAYVFVDRDQSHRARSHHDPTTVVATRSVTIVADSFGDVGLKDSTMLARSAVESEPPATVAGPSRLAGGGASLTSMLPPSLLEAARHAVWDEDASAALERFTAAVFDTNGDGTLDDAERIVAVRAIRAAAWPETSDRIDDDASDAPHPPQADDATGPTAQATLSSNDRRLHHDVDQARRRDRQDGRAASHLHDELRADIIRRFQTDDDGRLTVAEFARYMAHRNAGSAAADLNADGRIDDADLRVFLDVASPIE